MDGLIDLLAANPLLLLFVVIGLGYLIGAIRLFGFSLGVAAVLFVGMALGAVDSRLQLPEYIYIIGLVLFVYAIGLQAGPGFFASFRRRGLRFSLLAVSLLALGGAVSMLLGWLFGFSPPQIVGVFCGALTNTPALAATIEAIKGMSDQLPAGAAKQLAAVSVVTYGLAYPFGVFGVILYFYLATRVFKVDLAHEETARLSEAGTEEILCVTYRITNPALVGQTIQKILATFEHTGFVLSRLKRGNATQVVQPDTVVAAGDLIMAVGSERGQELARLLFGERASENIPDQRDEMSYCRVFVSNPAVIGKTIEEIRALEPFPGAITRLRRGDVEFVPTPSTMLERGDRILVVTRLEDADKVAIFFGDSIKSISEADYLSLSLGIVLGVFVGMIPFPLPGGMTFKLGFAGGPLVVGLILGRLERTGPIIWGMPFNANLVLRQIGLVFFLAAIGTRAGQGFGATFEAGGWSLVLAGAIVTSTVSVVTLFIGYRLLKLPLAAVMGMLSGMQTQPACLAYANQHSQNELPNTWYATVYPASMIAKILLAQVIVTALLTAS